MEMKAPDTITVHLKLKGKKKLLKALKELGKASKKAMRPLSKKDRNTLIGGEPIDLNATINAIVGKGLGLVAVKHKKNRTKASIEAAIQESRNKKRRK